MNKPAFFFFFFSAVHAGGKERLEGRGKKFFSLGWFVPCLRNAIEFLCFLSCCMVRCIKMGLTRFVTPSNFFVS